ncbi:Clr5 domain-containing protein [Aspergillus vadensis CBS 113365]|uniref:Clr5 domain-containing protein n=1 Tax=Aspergillus vadensis (strain CBS 113365 / IMI 142717 / IBT 24658) TaxID=1448311 RepID=A0A319BE00_ASPVC|nr:hypothetical protein BO88DRAFT_480595 [Aspergillus vadensis CBS 113365]PYH70341.1 hypothetical protein BO88DRAFT_480595 [Aspergillus vadensis CBS 113365]
MPSFIDLEPYKADIISLFHQDCSTARIISIVEARYHVQVSKYIIKTRLSGWGVSKHDYTATTDSSLHSRIKELFFERCLSDAEILYTIQAEEYTLLFAYIHNKYLIILRYRLYNIYYIIAPEAIQ